MEILSEKAVEIINDLHTERLDYTSEYIPLIDAALKLGEYENTGLEPEHVEHVKLALMGKSVAEIKEFEGIPVERLQELAKAEKDGRLVVLPCTVGDIAYELIRYCDDQICDKAYLGCGECHGYNKTEVRKCRMGSVAQIVASMPYIGKTVFLAREEAEAALEKMVKEDNEAD